MRCTITTPDQLKLKRGCRDSTTDPVGSAVRTTKKAGTVHGTVKKAVKYTAAVARWIKAGRPMRSQEEIDQNLAICRTCEDFDLVHEACKRCQCKCNKKPKPLVNMIAMATEHCKATPPKW